MKVKDSNPDGFVWRLTLWLTGNKHWIQNCLIDPGLFERRWFHWRREFWCFLSSSWHFLSLTARLSTLTMCLLILQKESTSVVDDSCRYWKLRNVTALENSDPLVSLCHLQVLSADPDPNNGMPHCLAASRKVGHGPTSR